jgi:lipoprotein-anchoring transpeptidase ErfK/SrfK
VAFALAISMTKVALLVCVALATAPVAEAARAAVSRKTGHGHTPVVSRVLAGQVMLDRAGFSTGEIDGRAGPNFRSAVAAFQQSRTLRASGRLDSATSRRLTEEFGPESAVTTYLVTDADVAGPFQPDVPADLIEQAKLPALEYRDALEALAEKFHSSPSLLKSLNPGKTFTSAGEQIVVPNVAQIDAAPVTSNASRSPARIVVTKHTSALTVEDEKGRVLFHAPVTTGSQHDPLPIGRWKVTGVQRSPAFHYNPDLFWDADQSHSKATIPPGPNNPVGVAWIDISKPHYGIHGTPTPSTIGHVQSHGCIRMTNWDVRRVLEWARPGTPVIFR